MKWRFWRKAAGPAAAFASAAGILAGHGTPVLAVVAAGGIGQLVDKTVDRPREVVVHDEANHERRAEAYEDFGAAIARVWASAGLLFTVRPKLVGYLHPMLLLMRSQRRLEEDHQATITSLHHVLLYGSTETQDATIRVFKTLGEKLAEVSRAGKQGSDAVKARLDEVSLDLGDTVAAWRRQAQADLTPGSLGT